MILAGGILVENNFLREKSVSSLASQETLTGKSLYFNELNQRGTSSEAFSSETLAEQGNIFPLSGKMRALFGLVCGDHSTRVGSDNRLKTVGLGTQKGFLEGKGRLATFVQCSSGCTALVEALPTPSRCGGEPREVEWVHENQGL
jgi:hypothetical protein